MSAKFPLGEGGTESSNSRMRLILIGVLIVAVVIFIVPKFLGRGSITGGGGGVGQSSYSAPPATEDMPATDTTVVGAPVLSSKGSGDDTGGVFGKLKTMAGGALPSVDVESVDSSGGVGDSLSSAAPPVSNNNVSVGGNVGCSCGKSYGCKGTPPISSVCYHTTVAGVWYCPGDTTPSGFRCIGPAWGK